MQTPHGVLIQNTNIKKLQIIQNTALFISTCCIRDTHIQSLQDKAIVLPKGTYLNLILHATHLKQMTQTHPLHNLNAHLHPQIN